MYGEVLWLADAGFLSLPVMVSESYGEQGHGRLVLRGQRPATRPGNAGKTGKHDCGGPSPPQRPGVDRRHGQLGVRLQVRGLVPAGMAGPSQAGRAAGEEKRAKSHGLWADLSPGTKIGILTGTGGGLVVILLAIIITVVGQTEQIPWTR